MSKKTFTLISLLVLGLCNLTRSQTRLSSIYHVTGVITDSLMNKPVEFVTVIVLDSTTRNIAGAYSDAAGQFIFSVPKKGKYNIYISYTGYQSKTIPVVIEADNQVTSVGPIYLTADTHQLKDVTITGQRQLVEQKPGMLVYHAEKDVTNLGGTAADVLRKAPVLSVDADGNVSMRGSTNLKILINGKYSGQMARSPADALNMIPSDMIKSVEVITSPSSRYDAEGTAGVINIITKKATEVLNGALELVLANWEQVFNPRAGFAKGKWVFNSYGHVHRSQVKRQTGLTRSGYESAGQLNQSSQTSYTNNARPHGMADFIVDYQADSNSLLSLSASGWFGNWPVNSTQDNIATNSKKITRQYQQRTKTDGAPNEGIDLSLGYSKKLKKPGQEFFVIGQYQNNFRDDFNYDTWHRSTEGNLLYQEQNRNHMQTKEWTLQSDYIHPLSRDGKSLLEAGVKAIFRDVVSEYGTLASSENDPGTLVPVQSRSNIFEYGQKVTATYLQAQLNFNRGWFVQAGVRFEATFLNGRFRSDYNPFKNRFSNLVPSATVVKKWNDAHSLTLSYTQRIARPSIIDLNPNIDARDSRNLMSGNPDLRPEASHQLELSHGFSGHSGFFLSTSFYGRQTNNSIEDVVRVNNEGVSLASRQNLAANKQYGVNLSASFSLSKGWSMSSNARAGYLNFTSRFLDIERDGWGWGVNLNTTYKLRNNYTLQAFGDYDSRAVTLQGRVGDWFYYSMALKKEWPASRITVGLSTVNPFAASVTRSAVTVASGFTSDNYTKYYNRAVKLTLNWKFGGSGRQINRKQVNNDDLKSSSEK